MTASILDIPDFLKREKEQPMDEPKEVPPCEGEKEEFELSPATVECSAENLNVILERIRDMTAQRDKITAALAAHKKAAQRMIGRL